MENKTEKLTEKLTKELLVKKGESLNEELELALGKIDSENNEGMKQVSQDSEALFLILEKIKVLSEKADNYETLLAEYDKQIDVLAEKNKNSSDIEQNKDKDTSDSSIEIVEGPKPQATQDGSLSLSTKTKYGDEEEENYSQSDPTSSIMPQQQPTPRTTGQIIRRRVLIGLGFLLGAAFIGFVSMFIPVVGPFLIGAAILAAKAVGIVGLTATATATTPWIVGGVATGVLAVPIVVGSIVAARSDFKKNNAERFKQKFPLDDSENMNDTTNNDNTEPTNTHSTKLIIGKTPPTKENQDNNVNRSQHNFYFQGYENLSKTTGENDIKQTNDNSTSIIPGEDQDNNNNQDKNNESGLRNK